MSFLLETHMHTSEGSACASADAASQVRYYKEAGYDGVIVTDHFVTGNSSVDRRLPWKEQMREQFKGVRNAMEEGRRIGLRVFCGIEFGYNATEFIVIGLGEEWFAEHPEITHMKPDESVPLFISAGAAVIQAHPYREARYIPKIRLYPEIVDAIEVFNLGNRPEWDVKARALAEKYGKPMTSGSDCHHVGYGGAGILLDHEPRDTEELISVIRSGKGYKLVEAERK